MDIKKINTLRNILTKDQKIIITSHMRPDGDSVGSSIGLQLFLKNYGIPSTVLLPDPYPEYLGWMEGIKDALIYQADQSGSRALIAEADIIFSLDYNDYSRTDRMGKYLKDSSGYKILIDHHPNPILEDFDLHFSYPDYSSTSEIVTKLIQEMELEVHICKHAAESLFTGIVTDTGSFKFVSSHMETMTIAALLMKKGVEPHEINRRVFDTNSESRLRLMGFSLSERLHVIPEYATAYIYLTSEDLKRYNYKDGDTEGLVNYGLSIKGINLAVLFTEKKGQVRLSLRSKTGFSVNQFARKHFTGGGHERAAGASSDLSMEDTIEKFKSLLPTYAKELQSIQQFDA